MMSMSEDGAPAFTRKHVELERRPDLYREAGEGEPLLFVHGYGVNGTLWDRPRGSSPQAHRCILPDLPFGSHPLPMRPDADLSPTGAAGDRRRADRGARPRRRSRSSPTTPAARSRRSSSPSGRPAPSASRAWC